MGRDGTLRQALWNAKVEELGLGPLGVETRYGCRSDRSEEKSIVLTWDGEDLPDMNRVEKRISEFETEWLASWGARDLSDAGKLELLDIVEKSFPDVGIGGGCSALSDEDRTKVLQVLNARIHGPAQDTEGSPRKADDFTE